MKSFEGEASERNEAQYKGLDVLMKHLEDNDERPDSLRAAKYIRALKNDKMKDELAAIDDALNRSDYTFTFFNGNQCPGSIVEPLFEAITAAEGHEKVAKAMEMIKALAEWEANN